MASAATTWSFATTAASTSPTRAPTRRDPSKVWYISPKGEKTSRRHRPEVRQRRDPLAGPVAALRGRRAAATGSTATRSSPTAHWLTSRSIIHLHVPDTADDAGADGMRVDRDGRLYVATRMGIQVCDQAGRVNCIIPTPNGKIANLCFGGAELRHPLRHLRRQGLQAEGEGQGGERLPGARSSPAAPALKRRSTDAMTGGARRRSGIVREVLNTPDDALRRPSAASGRTRHRSGRLPSC